MIELFRIVRIEKLSMRKFLKKRFKNICMIFVFSNLISACFASDSYCPLGACKGFDVREYYPDPEVENIVLNPSNSYVPVPPKLNADWSRLASELGIVPEDYDFKADYSKSVGVCSNDFTFFVEVDGDYSNDFEKIKNRIVKDTGYEGERFEIQEPKSIAERDGDHFVWKDNNLTNLTGVEMIFLKGWTADDLLTHSGFINVHVVYDNYKDCRKEDQRLPEIPDPRIKFIESK